MEIKQKPDFLPITITLNTSEEATDFWALIRWDGKELLTYSQIDLANELSDWFSNEAHL